MLAADWHPQVVLFIQIPVALGTLGLAAVTVALVTKTTRLGKETRVLAERTADMAGAAVAEADVTMRAFQASVRPLLTDVPLNMYVREEVRLPATGGFGATSIPRLDRGAIEMGVRPNTGVHIEVPIRNIGQGPAFVHRAFVTNGPGSVWEALSSHAVVGVGDLVYVLLYLESHAVGFDALQATVSLRSRLRVGIQYSDGSDAQRTQTVLLIEQLEDETAPTVVAVDIFKCNDRWLPEATPFISSRAVPESGRSSA